MNNFIKVGMLTILLVSCSTTSIEHSRTPQQSLFKRCADTLSSLISRKPTVQYFSESEAIELRAAVNEWNMPAFGRLKNGSNDYLAFFYTSAPQTIKDLFRKMPMGEKEQLSFLRQIADITEVHSKSNTIFSSFYNTMESRSAWPNRGIFDGNAFMDDLEKIYRDMPANRLSEISLEIDDYLKLFEAKSYFHSNFFYRFELISKGRKNYIKIKDDLIEVKQKNGSYILYAPKSLVSIRGDNPLDTKNLKGIAESSVKPPSVYSGAVGLNGRFYLNDGNHRFTVKEFRDFVPIDIGSRLETLGIEHHLIFLGSLAPSDDLILKLHNKEVTPYEILSDKVRRGMIWSESELVNLP